MKKFLLILLVISALFIIAAKKPKPTDITGYEITTSSVLVEPSAYEYVTAYCSEGKLVLGGGFERPMEWSFIVSESHPNNDGTGWVIQVYQTTSSPKQVTTFAICADVAQ
jgi:hypothetical protein